MSELSSVKKDEYVPNKFLSSVYEWISAAIVAMIVVAVIFSAFFRTVNVDGDSMKNTLQNGDRLLISGLFYSPDYGDIVVIRRTDDTPLIKRVIGLPGDTIYINDRNGLVYRNGIALDEPYILPNSIERPTPSRGITTEVVVKEGEVYVMGDNRGGSLDSRQLGCQPIKNVVGRVILRLTPNFGKVTNGE